MYTIQPRDSETAGSRLAAYPAAANFPITPDFEIGARFGWGLNRDAPNIFSNVGLGWRY